MGGGYYYEQPRSGFGLLPLNDGRIFALGGSSNGTDLNTVESLDLSSHLWTIQDRRLPQAVFDGMMAVDESGNAMVAGGYNYSGPDTAAYETRQEDDESPHTVKFYLHGAEAAGDYSALVMDEVSPSASPSAVINLNNGQSWVSSPALLGTLQPGATVSVTLPCSLGIGIGTTFTLSTEDEDGNNPWTFGTTTQPLSLCLLSGSATINIPLQTFHNDGYIEFKNRVLRLTIQNLIGLNLTFNASNKGYLQLTNYTGEPFPN